MNNEEVINSSRRSGIPTYSGQFATRKEFIPRNEGQSAIGFTLLEVMIALLILTLGLTSVFSLFGAGTRSLNRAVTDQMVTCYARTIFSELDSGLMTWSIPPQNRFDQTHQDFPDYVKYDIEFTTLDSLNTAIPDAGSNAVYVTLTIKWPRGPTSQSEKFQMMLLKKNK